MIQRSETVSRRGGALTLALQDPSHMQLFPRDSQSLGYVHLSFLQLYSHPDHFISHLLFKNKFCTPLINFLFCSTKISLERMKDLKFWCNTLHNKITFNCVISFLMSSNGKDQTNSCTYQSSEMATLLTVQYPGSWFSEQESTVKEAACTAREGNVQPGATAPSVLFQPTLPRAVSMWTWLWNCDNILI